MRFVQPSRKQPKILDAFKLSVETLAKHFYLLLFPILFDVFFLFSRRLLVSDQAKNLIDAVILPPTVSEEVANNWAQISQQFISLLENFSLTGFLRSYPIGIPSLLAFRPMENNPMGTFASSQVQSLGMLLQYVAIFSLIGFVLGALFLLVVGNAAQGGSLRFVFKDFWRKLSALFAIPVLSAVGFFLLFIPAMFLIALIANFLPFLGSIGYFILSLVLISRLTPLFFTPHDIVLFNHPFTKAMKESVKTVRPTNGKVSIFLLLIFLASYATNFLWQLPKDDSWMLLIAIFGHALVTTLAFIASYHFYIDARNCVLESNTIEADPAQPLT